MNSPPHGILGLRPFVWGPVDLAVVALLGLLTILLLGAVGWGLLAHWRRRRHRRSLAAPAAIDPRREVLAQIAGLQVGQPFDRQSQVEFYWQLSLLFRRALEMSCNIPATDRTVRELKVALDQHFPPSTPSTRKDWFVFLEQADRVKFAAESTTADQARHYQAQALAWARRLLEPQLATSDQSLNQQAN